MGKRKERRLAAMSAANRRVKLDLFAEPSGEMMGTSVHDEVGGDLDKDHRAGVPTSPSSLGHEQENPLLLLGQYSDDELDEETSKRPKHDADGSSSSVLDGQILEPTEVGENVGGNTEKDIADGDNKQESDQVDTIKNLDGIDGKESDSTYAATQYCETDLVTQISIPEPSGIHLNGDLTGGWKVVVHEESNRYYYWNTVTGETSWEVPTVLAGEQTVPSGIEGAGSHVDMLTVTHLSTESAAYAYTSAVDGLGSSNLISKDAGEYGNVLEIKNENGEVAHLAYDANQSLAHYSTAVPGIPYADSSALSDFGSLLQTNDVTREQLTIPLAERHVSNDEDKDKHLRKPNECYETADIHSAQLVKYSESLLQRLEALDRSGNRLEGHEGVMKEIEIRLSDCKALSSYGSCLLPFWWHTETQLKQLESAISKGQASRLVQRKHDSKLEATKNSSLRDECSLQSIGAGSEVIVKDKGISSTVINSFSSSPDASKVQIEATSQMPDSEDVKIKGLSPGSPHQPFGSEQKPEIVLEANRNNASVHLVESHADEDMDMDVEMEVDEEIPSGQTATGYVASTECPSPLEELIEPNQSSSECPLVPLDEPSVPPPTDEERIPPLPPDIEPVPPPPEEPSAPSFPPSFPDTITCPPNPDQYNLGYTVPAYEYYAPTVGEITNGNYYAQAVGSHISEPQPPPYYEPVVASSLPDGAGDLNPVEPVTYYDVFSGNVPPGPVVGSMGSSGYYIEPRSISYHSMHPASDHTASVGFTMDFGSSSLPEVKFEPDTSAVVSESQTSILQAVSVASSAQSVGTTLMNGSAVDAPSLAATKNQTKVVRSKRRTIAAAPTLRSNKKVSSLVDKWKAAKEELHGEEDEEPENSYEVLEKKCQKEIEDWRARQIASGEAQDNANFLPLGGDWRERVKRKKAKAKTETVQSPTEVVDNGRKQPDLVELSKDVPSGWQAYWDESSKEVYYGNSITSETTWTRPTR